MHHGHITSNVCGFEILISLEVLSEILDLPIGGMNDLSLISDESLDKAWLEMRKGNSLLDMSCFKRELKMEYEVLADIVGKAVEGRAGSFTRLTEMHCQMMTAIVVGERLN